LETGVLLVDASINADQLTTADEPGEDTS